MDIRQLHYFLTLCEEMNYTRAAQRLFLSRQALRQSISALEAEMCGPLFISAHHKLALTDRGMSLQRHAAPVVEQFQQMQAALRAEIQSAQPVRIGISVALVPDYLPGLETQLDKFRQQYPHVEMRFRLLDNDAVADGVEQGELDAGLVIDLGCAAPVLARTTLRADPACLLVPRGHPFWEKERIPLAELRGQRVLLPSLRQDLFSPLWAACARAGFAPNAEIGPSFYQAYYLVQEQLCTCLTRYEPGARRELDRVRDVLLEDMPPAVRVAGAAAGHQLCLYRPAAQLPVRGSGQHRQPATPPGSAGKALLHRAGAFQRRRKGCPEASRPGHPAALCGRQQLPGAGRLPRRRGQDRKVGGRSTGVSPPGG